MSSAFKLIGFTRPSNTWHQKPDKATQIGRMEDLICAVYRQEDKKSMV